MNSFLLFLHTFFPFANSIINSLSVGAGLIPTFTARLAPRRVRWQLAGALSVPPKHRTASHLSAAFSPPPSPLLLLLLHLRHLFKDKGESRLLLDGSI